MSFLIQKILNEDYDVADAAIFQDMASLFDEETGGYPLHSAVQKSAPYYFVNKLLEHFPAAVNIKNKEGNLPIDIAINKKAFLVVQNALRLPPAQLSSSSSLTLPPTNPLPALIGIAGASCSGKSTLSNRLHSIFACRNDVICQDIFATNDIPLLAGTGTGSSSTVSNKWHNWECMETMNTLSLIETIVNARERSRALGDKVLLVEGFLLFVDERVSEMFDVKIFIDIEKEECYSRRRQRSTDSINGYSASKEYRDLKRRQEEEEEEEEERGQEQEKEQGQENEGLASPSTPSSISYSSPSSPPFIPSLSTPSERPPRRHKHWTREYFDEVIWTHYLLYKPAIDCLDQGGKNINNSSSVGVGEGSLLCVCDEGSEERPLERVRGSSDVGETTGGAVVTTTMHVLYALASKSGLQDKDMEKDKEKEIPTSTSIEASALAVLRRYGIIPPSSL